MIIGYVTKNILQFSYANINCREFNAIFRKFFNLCVRRSNNLRLN